MTVVVWIGKNSCFTLIMNENIRRKKQEIINKKVYQEYSELDCIKLLNAKERDGIEKTFISALDEIRSI